MSQRPEETLSDVERYAGDHVLGCEFKKMPTSVFQRLSSEGTSDFYDDVNVLFETFAGRRLDLAQRVWEALALILSQADTATRLAAVIKTAAQRALDEYQAVRAALINCMEAYADMSAVQRLALLAVFTAAVMWQVMRRRVTRDNKGREDDGELRADEFPYVKRIAEQTRLNLVVCNRCVKEYDLVQLHTAFNLLLHAVYVCGDTSQRQSARRYWNALWDRFAALMAGDFIRPSLSSLALGRGRVQGDHTLASFLSASEGENIMQSWGLSFAEHDRANVRSNVLDDISGESVLNLQFVTEPAALETDVKTHRLPHALPVVHAGRRMRLCYLEAMECSYHVQLHRFNAVAVFAEAARTPNARTLTQDLQRLVGNPVSTLLEFVAEIKHHPDDTIERYLRETTSTFIGCAHLMPGELEHYVLLSVNTAAKASGQGSVQTRPAAEEVLSSLRMDDYAVMCKLETAGKGNADGGLEKVTKDFFRTEELRLHALRAAPVSFDEPLLLQQATATERYAILLMSLCLDACMMYQECPTQLRFTLNNYIDELAQGLPPADPSATSVPLPRRPPATPEAALLDYNGKVSRCVLVRIMRRNFIVAARAASNSERVSSPLVLEFPSFTVALVVWLALVQLPAKGNERNERFIPAALLAIVRRVRAGH